MEGYWLPCSVASYLVSGRKHCLGLDASGDRIRAQAYAGLRAEMLNLRQTFVGGTGYEGLSLFRLFHRLAAVGRFGGTIDADFGP